MFVRESPSLVLRPPVIRRHRTPSRARTSSLGSGGFDALPASIPDWRVSGRQRKEISRLVPVSTPAIRPIPASRLPPRAAPSITELAPPVGTGDRRVLQSPLKKRTEASVIPQAGYNAAFPPAQTIPDQARTGGAQGEAP